MTYTRDTPLLINGEDIITVLDREDVLLSKNVRQFLIFCIFHGSVSY